MKLRLRLPLTNRRCAGLAVVLALSSMGVFAAAARRAHPSEQAPAPRVPARSFEMVPLETVSETTANASIGDVNGDGHLDIVLAKGRHWPLASVVFFGDGKGHFTRGPALPTPPRRSYAAALAAMTRSGHLDIVLSNDSPDPKLVLLNDGSGHFMPGGTFGDPNWPTRNIAVGDLNGDGLPDIAVANRGKPSYVCFNQGLRKAALGPAATVPQLSFDCRGLKDTPSAASIAIADINGDGFPDVILACRDECQSLIYFNDGKGNFTREQPWGPPKSSTRAISIADFDGSGRPSIAACHEGLGCFVYLNDGNGNLASGIQFQKPGALPYSMIAADLNRDGRAEIVVGYVEAPGIIFFNDGTGKGYIPQSFGDGKGAIYGLAVGDLDEDGWPDIAVARSGAPSFVLFNRPAK
ncbi:MAG TPA: VCBS repeat-containing protein [Candidatus Cybelea sp.]|nr:VCBS repeat-containing protein [Candidatus Cybelea sp.]